MTLADNLQDTMKNKYTEERGKHGNNELNEWKKYIYIVLTQPCPVHTKEMKTFTNNNFIHINLHKENNIFECEWMTTMQLSMEFIIQRTIYNL